MDTINQNNFSGDPMLAERESVKFFERSKANRLLESFAGQTMEVTICKANGARRTLQGHLRGSFGDWYIDEKDHLKSIPLSRVYSIKVNSIYIHPKSERNSIESQK